MPDNNAQPSAPQPHCDAAALRRREYGFMLEQALIGLVACGYLAMAMPLPAADASLDAMLDAQSGLFLQLQQSIQNVLIVTLTIGTAFVLLKDAVSGRSPAKLLLGLRVVDARTGEGIGPIKSIVRNFLLLLPVLPLVEAVVANLRADHRRLGDLLANTTVVRTR